MAIKGYWKFNGNSNDASGNGNNGTDTNITYLPNGGASFNGTSSKIDIGNKTSLNLISYTCSGLFKYSSISPEIQYFIYKGIVASGSEPISCWHYYGKPTIENYRARYYDKYARTTNSFADDKLHHIVMIRNAGIGYFIYVDGVYVSQSNTNPDSNTTVTTTGSFTIGARNASEFSYYNGIMKELIVDAVAWSPAKIKNEYSRIKGFF